jgi:hypothetical protein
MDIKDIYPPDGKMQRIHCPACGTHCDLGYTDFSELLSGVRIQISGLPVLRCPKCGTENLPDLSRLAIIDCHKRSVDAGENAFISTRRKPEKRFDFTPVPFLYDSDDYRYIPGLVRPWDQGFLTPVFFNRAVLFKYDNAPGYRVRFASTTYGTIHTEDEYISFGINRHGRIVMWLGDIGKLPVSEQHYLRSENVPSDHSIGSEFYDGQINVVFTPRSKEDELFRQRSNFIEACLQRFGEKLAHLDAEVMELALSFNPPVVDTPKERRHVADTLNKIYLESLDNGALAKALTAQGGDPKSLGSLKRLQGVLEKALPGEDVASKLSPLYVLYDLRVAYSHLHSTERAEDTLQKVTDRLGLARTVGLMAIYAALVGQLTESFAALAPLIDPQGTYDPPPPTV